VIETPSAASQATSPAQQSTTPKTEPHTLPNPPHALHIPTLRPGRPTPLPRRNIQFSLLALIQHRPQLARNTRVHKHRLISSR
jgi:hypothetical protein